MILRLVVLQFRSAWKSTLSIAATLALAVGFGTFAMVLAATQIAHQESDYEDFRYGYEHVAEFHTVLGDPIPQVSDAQLENVVSLDEVEALVQSAANHGPVVATSSTYGRVPGPDEGVDIALSLPNPDDERYLSRGSLPKAGEIALGATLAASLDITVGDPITLVNIDPRVPTTVTLTVSGILRDGGVNPYWTWVPGGIASWDDFEYLATFLPTWVFVDPETEEVATVMSTQVHWNEDNPVLSPYESYSGWMYEGGFRWSDAFNYLNGPAGWALLLAGITVACLVTAALGMGRSHAESRARWSGTARVLGATRGTIATASVVETLVVSVAGVGVGFGAGALAAHLHLVYLRLSHPDGFLPSAISVPSVLVGVGVLVGMAIAVILAAVPAFWASRVAPVTALKPVSPIRDATLSRVVNPWWPFQIMAAGVVISVVLQRLNLDGSLGPIGDLGAGLGQILGLVAGAAVVVQVARGLVSIVGRQLARSRVSWILAAGDGLLSHRRSSTFASLAMIVVASLFTAYTTTNSFNGLEWSEDYRGWGELPHVSFSDWWQSWIAAPGVLTFAAVAFAVIVVMATIVRTTSRRSTAQEDATRSALGLSHRDARAAVALRDAAVMATGTVVGGLAGWALSLAWRIVGAAIFPDDLVYSLEWNATSAAYGLAATGAIIGLGLFASVVTGLLVSRLAVATPPVAAIGRSDG
ncbi:MAG: hypothetical protein JW722_02820 [Demequinaceae bacterium]|nr:hypothetical protein [Demequinaceae bacterium]